MKITISYQKNWSEDGTVYDQRVKIDEYYRNEVNMYIQANMDLAEKDKRDWYTLIYLRTLDSGINYTNLTTSRYVKQWLEIMGVPTDRYLDRNTIIEFS